MKNTIIIFLFCFLGFTTIAQQSHIAEHSCVLTDRAFYISGEEIQFSGILSLASSEKPISMVVYIELIDPIGNKINQQKLYLNHKQFSGKIIIPESTISGTYYLIAYSKWMRNNTASYFDKVALKIVNPFLIEIQHYPDSIYSKETKLISSQKQSVTNNRYTVGETISINLSDLGVNQFELCQVSLVPKGSHQFVQLFSNENTNTYQKATFYPETRGLSISGKAFKNGSISPHHLIYLNVMGQQDFQSVYTNGNGQFYFSLPKKYNYNELMIGAQQKPGEAIVLEIDNDFYTGPINLKAQKLFVSEQEKELSLQLTKQYQINKWYFDSIKVGSKKETSIPFYQYQFKTIDFDFYILLDSMSQYFTDIPSYVQLKRNKGKRYFQIIGDDIDLSVYEPLLLVDWIPINEAERILALDPKLVKKIDIENKVFYHGNKQYGGIIHVQTRDGDMANLKFPETNIYLNYLFPEKTDQESADIQFPGTPYYKLLQQKQTQIEFKAPKLAGDYILLVQVINQQLQKTYYELPIIVELDD